MKHKASRVMQRTNARANNFEDLCPILKEQFTKDVDELCLNGKILYSKRQWPELAPLCCAAIIIIILFTKEHVWLMTAQMKTSSLPKVKWSLFLNCSS